MARIVGVDIPNDKKVLYALTYIYGIGLSTSKKLLSTINVDPDKRVKELSDEEIANIAKEINNSYVVEGDLRQRIQKDIKRLIDINSYRGHRHKVGLPVRGQKTKTNARTWKGPRSGRIRRK